MLLAIGGFVGCITGFHWSRENHLDDLDLLIGLVGAFGGIIIAGLCMVILSFVFKGDQYKAYKYEDKVIYSLETGSETTSDFILGIGGSDTKIKYYYYTKDEEGLYSLESILASSAKIKEDSQSESMIRKKIGYYKNKFLNLLMLGEYLDSCVIVVPEGTIRKQFAGNFN